ncbi:MAG: restriction endonuclease subunit S [Immundisolibacteraceae bacterium]|nr:restriction endonuclease subunit S [Immundisolibacteraceae bacterium]
MALNETRLADCCIIKPPKSEARKTLDDGDKVSFVPMHNLGINKKLFSLDEDKRLSEVSGSYTYFADNDVLLAKITPCFENGKLGIAKGLTNGVGFGSSEFVVFRSKGEITPDYLYYFLLQPSFREIGQSVMTGAVGHKRVPKDFIENTVIPLPSIPEQKRIVAILDQAFADIEQARAKTEQNLRNARELFESYLQQVFSQRGEGWVEKRLESLCTFSSGGTPSKKNDSYWNGAIPWVSGRDMKSTQLSDSILHISQSAVDESSTRMAPTGSILTLVRGMGLAHGAQVAELMVPCAYNQDIRGIHPEPYMVSRYLVFALRHQINSSDNVLSSAAHGTLKINLDELKNVVIPVPPTEQQEGIVDSFNALIERVDCLESIYQKKLTALDELKKSILHLAFTGQLTPSVEPAEAKGAAA